MLRESADLPHEFYQFQSFDGFTVFDPFLGSGTTAGEGHKLEFTVLGRDINPVAIEAVVTALGPMERQKLLEAFEILESSVGRRIRAFYRSRDSAGRNCDVLYHFWVMETKCLECERTMDLFPSYIVARNANPDQKPGVQVLCPACGEVFPGLRRQNDVTCSFCSHRFDPHRGPANGKVAWCGHCQKEFSILSAISVQNSRPRFRLYAKLVLDCAGRKEYLRANAEDLAAYERCTLELDHELRDGNIRLPNLDLAHGFNTRQAMRYGFNSWRDFFNDRQLLSLGLLQRGIQQLPDAASRRAMMTLFSGVLEFNNLFATYKGEGTGAVRHMFSHHILKPERTPIEANIWGTAKSSGSFSTLFRGRILRALDYRLSPTEVKGKKGPSRICSQPFSGRLESSWPTHGSFTPRGIYLSCGDSAKCELPDRSIDLVVTDPPFFDNVHYSELADFFFAWQQLDEVAASEYRSTTRNVSEVQDSNAEHFSKKLQAVFCECRRVLKDDGLLVFTYHHSRDDGWRSLTEAIFGAGFGVLNAHPVKAEMSVATPKSQAKEPIQLDIIFVCRKQDHGSARSMALRDEAISSAWDKLSRLNRQGIRLSRNDKKIVLYGQLLTTLQSAEDVGTIVELVDSQLATMQPEIRVQPLPEQGLLF